MGEFKSLLRKTSDDYHGPRSLPLVGKFGEVSYAPRRQRPDPYTPRPNGGTKPSDKGRREFPGLNPDGEVPVTIVRCDSCR